MEIVRPQFRSSFMGLNKNGVLDYIDKLEAELQDCESREKTRSFQLRSAYEEMDKIKEQLAAQEEEKALLIAAQEEEKSLLIAAQEEEKSLLLEKNELLRKELSDFRQQLKEEQKRCGELELSIQQVKKELSDSAPDPRIIQDALISAQRMSDIVISEANQEAQEIRSQANAEYLEKQQAGDELVAQAREDAHMIQLRVQDRCSQLRSSYDELLNEASQFKSELIEMYRQHLTFLSNFPMPKEFPAIEENILEIFGADE